MRKLKQVIAVTVFLMGATLATAADILWVSTIDGDWNNPNNWWPAQVPGAGDYAHIILNGAFYVNLNGNVTVDRWELGADLGSQGCMSSKPFAPFVMCDSAVCNVVDLAL